MNKTPAYTLDGRRPVHELFSSYNKLLDFGWTRSTVCTQDGDFPVYAYISAQNHENEPKLSLWILSGIHGEEPAGPNALAESIENITQLANSFPIVLMPMLNPASYNTDSRYFDAHRGEGSSVTDADFLLKKTGQPNKYSEKIIRYVLKLAKTNPPLVVVDHHEDELDLKANTIDAGYTYGYCYGNTKILDPLCKQITKSLISAGFPIQEEGETRFGEKVHHGFVTNNSDGSIDELLATLGAKAVLAVETTRNDDMPITLRTRIDTQKVIIGLYQFLWDAVNKVL